MALTRWGVALGLCLGLAGLGPVPVPMPRPDVVAAAGPSLAVPPDRGARAPSAEVGPAPVAPATPAPVATVATPVDADGGPGTALRQAQPFSGQSGWYVVDLDSGQVLDQGAADTGFTPASVAKLPTAVYALDRLGAQHRFTTRLLGTGPVTDGVLAGDLVLAGGGDPELDSDGLAALIAAARGAGLTAVSGRLVVDGGTGVRTPAIDPTQPVDAGYNPGVSGLNLNFNRVRVTWDAQKRASRLTVTAMAERLNPAVRAITVRPDDTPDAPIFVHEMTGAGEQWRMAERAIRGRGAVSLPVKAPDLYAGDVLRKLAAAHGVDLAVAEPGAAPAGAQGLARLDSRPLADMLRDMLRHSTNLTAEAVGVAASAQGLETRVAEAQGFGTLLGQVIAPGAAASPAQPGAPRNLAQSAEAMNAWANALMGLPVGDPGFRMVNHSGLSTESRVTPRRMVQFLVAVARRPAGPGTTHPRLPGPVAGLLKDYNAAAEAAEIDFARLDIVAKTGTMDYVRGLAGYVATPGGRRLAFAVFSNDLARRPPVPGSIDKVWMGRARGFERALIRAWVQAADSRRG